MKINDVIAKYIELRDEKAQLEAEHKKAKAALDEKMDKIEAALLKAFAEAGGIDSVKTDAGTAYVSTRMQASVADREAFINHIRESGEWFLLEVRSNKQGVEQYIAANEGQIPPGVSIRSETVVNVRRA